MEVGSSTFSPIHWEKKGEFGCRKLGQGRKRDRGRLSPQFTASFPRLYAKSASSRISQRAPSPEAVPDPRAHPGSRAAFGEPQQHSGLGATGKSGPGIPRQRLSQGRGDGCRNHGTVVQTRVSATCPSSSPGSRQTGNHNPTCRVLSSSHPLCSELLGHLCLSGCLLGASSPSSTSVSPCFSPPGSLALQQHKSGQPRRGAQISTAGDKSWLQPAPSAAPQPHGAASPLSQREKVTRCYQPSCAGGTGQGGRGQAAAEPRGGQPQLRRQGTTACSPAPALPLLASRGKLEKPVTRCSKKKH